MKILKLHSNGKIVYIDTTNIVACVFNSENGKVNLVTNSLKGVRLEVDEPLWQIQEQYDLKGEINGNNERDAS